LSIELQTPEYCREIEAYLCRKNDGHLIRVTGPSFDLVAGWAELGVPIKVAFEGIDRYFERYYRNGPRRRPVKIDFCKADVLDVFDEWRRATGLTDRDVRPASPGAGSEGLDEGSRDAESRHASLPEHLKRVVLRLTAARSTGTIDASFDALIDRAATELDAARSAARGLRGAARQTLIDRLESLDRELLQQARSLLEDATRNALVREADEQLAPFRGRLGAEALAPARDRAIDRLVRERYALPVIAFRQA
jgi:hypothetical protein